MKTAKWFFALVMGFAMVACAPKSDDAASNDDENIPAEKTAKDLKPSAKEVADVSYLVGINFGAFIKNNGFEGLNMAEVRKGMNDFINAKGDQRSEEFVEQFRVNPNDMGTLFNNYLSNLRQLKILNNKEKEDKFLAANAKKAGVQTTASGLQYKIISEGNENKPSSLDTVWVRYKGSLLDGTVFDETTGEDAIHFTLNRVVKGWSEGLQLIGEGGEIELYIPAALGYGDRAPQGSPIEPGSTLIFNVSLEKVGKKQ